MLSVFGGNDRLLEVPGSLAVHVDGLFGGSRLGQLIHVVAGLNGIGNRCDSCVCIRSGRRWPGSNCRRGQEGIPFKAYGSNSLTIYSLPRILNSRRGHKLDVLSLAAI